MGINHLQTSNKKLSTQEDYVSHLRAAGLPVSFGKSCKSVFEKSLPAVTRMTSSIASNDDSLNTYQASHFKGTANEMFEATNEFEGDKFDIAVDPNQNYKGEEFISSTKVESNNYSTVVPFACEVSIPCHSKMVTALTVNAKASRMITGGMDFQMRLWDFNGMTSTMHSFRQIEPNEGHAPQGLDYAINGSHFVCAAGGTSCLLYDLNANLLHETVKGDMYIRDMAQTKGHTHMITDCHFHPFDRSVFMSAAMDATIRIWDVNSKPYGVDRALAHIQCLKAIDKRNLNINQCHVLCSAWAPVDGRCIIGGCVDGSLQIWNEKKQYGKPDHVLRGAHESEITSIKFFTDNQRFLSRSLDDTMKLWDIRKLTAEAVVHTWTDLKTIAAKTNIELSPDNKFILTSTQGSKADPCGSLHIYDSDTYNSVKVLSFKETSPIFVIWPSEINQLICGCNDGSVRMLYDPSVSQKGALLFVNRVKEKKQEDVTSMNPPIFTMDTLPQGYKETRSGMIRKVKPRGKEKERIERETMKALIPPRPSGKEGSGGLLASHHSLSQMVLGKIGKSSLKDEDPTELLRGYASVAETNSLLVGSAYKRTQPQPVLDYSMEKNEEEVLLSSTEKCSRCGLKMCQCGYLTLQKSIFGATKIRRTN